MLSHQKYFLSGLGWSCYVFFLEFTIEGWRESLGDKLFLTFLLLVANLAYTKRLKKPEKWLKPWWMGIHLWVLYESFQMKTKMTGFQCFFKNLVLWTKVVSALEGLRCAQSLRYLLLPNCPSSHSLRGKRNIIPLGNAIPPPPLGYGTISDRSAQDLGGHKDDQRSALTSGGVRVVYCK